MKNIKLKTKILFGFLIASIILINGCIQTAVEPITSIPSEKTISTSKLTEGIGIPNPAAVHCIGLGYKYKIVRTDKGEEGRCIFPDETECDGWAFFEGKCGKEHSYCRKHGYDIKTKSDGRDPFSREYAVCVTQDKDEEVGSVTNLTNLNGKITNWYNLSKRMEIQK